MEGRRADTLDSVKHLRDAMPDELLLAMPGADWYVTEQYAALDRFRFVGPDPGGAGAQFEADRADRWLSVCEGQCARQKKGRPEDCERQCWLNWRSLPWRRPRMHRQA